MFFFDIFFSVASHRGQPAAKCHLRWQPTRGLALSCELGRYWIQTRDCRTTVRRATTEPPCLPTEPPCLPGNYQGFSKAFLKAVKKCALCENSSIFCVRSRHFTWWITVKKSKVFWTEILGIAWIQGFQELVWRRCGRWGQWYKLRQALACLALEQAVVETQQWWRKHERRVLPTRLRHDTAGSAARRVRTVYIHITNPHAS